MQKKKLPNLRFVFDRKHLATNSHGVAEPRKGLVQLEIYINRRRKYISTGVKVYANQWDDQRHVINCANAVEYNRMLNTLYSDSFKELATLVESGDGDINILGAVIADNGVSFFDYAEKKIADMSIKPSTTLSYMAALENARSTGIFKGLRDVKLWHIQKYESFLTQKGLCAETRRSYHSKLQRIFSLALRDGLVKETPYALFDMPSGRRNERRYLTAEQLHRLENLDIRGLARTKRWSLPFANMLSVVKDLFLFQCYTGLAYIDMSTLEKNDIVKTDKGYCVSRQRIKSGEIYKIMLLKPALALMRKYKFELPNVVFTTYNQYLRTIGELVGLDFRLTSHIGRHTFATWVLSHGIPIEIVSKMLGHTDIKTTQIYAKVLADDVNNAFLKLDEKL